jgi:hypothetical protein
MTTTPDRPPAVLECSTPELIRIQWDAECQFIAALAQFQATVQPVAELNLATIVQHAKPAFDLGFCYLVRQDSAGVEVILRHAGGAEEISSADAATLCSPALLLAGLLGIPVAVPTQAADPGQHEEEPEHVQSEPYAEDASAPAEPAPGLVGGDWQGRLDPVLEPLSEEQIQAAIAMVKQMDAHKRKSFNIAFRNAFDIDQSVLRITGHIKQLQHLEFIDRFSVEAAGGIAP